MTTMRSCPFVIQTTITKAPKTQQGAEKHLSKVQQGAVQHSSKVPDGFVQLTDRNGNSTDALTPAGSLPPVGWYPGDDDYVHKEFPKEKALLSTPPKTVLPKDYDAATGCTPAGANINEWRIGWPRPGIPGETEKNSYNLATPTRDKA